MPNNLKSVEKPTPGMPEIRILTTDCDNIFDQNVFEPPISAFIQKKIEQKMLYFRLPYINKDIFVQIIQKIPEDASKKLELFRSSGSRAAKGIFPYKFEKINICFVKETKINLAWIEGFLLAQYQFIKYKTDPEIFVFPELNICSKNIRQKDLEQLKIIAEANHFARDLVNEPGSVLTSTEFANRLVKLGQENGFITEVFNKQKISTLKMGGLLAVNRGSKQPPTFSILEWKPKNAINQNPIVLIGKGLVFDTGGLSLKPTSGSMDEMKCDMAGGAVVAGIFYAVSKLKLPVHLIGLIPSTDNRPGEDAYLPGDVITISDGTTVEVLNCDAEGRLILADALSYAKQYNPELVFDFATLTGSASMAIGKYGIVFFSNADAQVKNSLFESGNEVYERLVEFPLWDEYGDLIKSDIADLKNIGGKEAGAITAAKFLEKFTDYPWAHFDIAGNAFLNSDMNYFSKGGSGIGIRLILNFLLNKTTNHE